MGSESGGNPGVGTGAGATIAKPKKVLTPQHMAWLVRQGFATKKSTNVISESVLEVALDLDVIRQLPGEPDSSVGVKPVPTATPQSGLPPAGTNTVPVNPSTNATPTP